MKNLYKINLAVILSLGSYCAIAQQDPMYTHYMYNTLVVNPGYAGSRDAFTITALHRSQWVDFKGAPVTQTLTMHAPLKNQHIGLGLALSNDKIGYNNNTSAFVDFSYIMKLNEKSKLALGLNAGGNILQARFTSVQLEQSSDPVFQNNVNNHFAPNFGFGAYYYRERFYAGISAPNLLENNYSTVQMKDGSVSLGKEQRHYFFIAGAVFNLTENLAFKPTTLIKSTNASPTQADITASFIIMKKLMLGVMYRTGDAFGALIGIDIAQQFHVGYSYDYSYGLETFKYNKGSHEIVLRYDFLCKNNKQIYTPRYF
jgi:type IX secretion system PorP/SprF family membrane protein